MKLGYFPTPKEVLDNEKKSFSFFVNQKEINEIYPVFWRNAHNEYVRLKTIKLEHCPIALLDFESYIDINLDGYPRRVYFGGLIRLDKQKNYEEVSYSITICENNKPSNVMRRFHFDFDPGIDSSKRSLKPFFHIQYGGKLSPLMIKEGFKDELHCQHIYSSLESPRIVHLPMSFIFLVFFIIKELDKEHAEILCRPEWRTQMLRSENLMLKQFYETCCKTINSKRESIFMDCYY